MFSFNRKVAMKSNRKNNEITEEKKEKKFRKGAACIVLILLPTLLLAACGQKNNAVSETETAKAQQSVEESTPQAVEESTSQSEETEASTGEDLIIPVSDITEEASFYPVTVDGIDMEIIAVKASDGSIRTAFNTCQICYNSGRGYYKQDGDKLVCQNCGNQFPMEQVEVEAGGCNPWPIFDENKTVTDDSITISYSFLQESEQIFANWK
ncbi:DUF2318 domain-containing protein [Kineothrix sedimenti]|uniref:DUF2318 domain-containing protein n=1 Tax=Kineothrix sedimenti TaxID=3123317 RepID=A0ABZ3ETG1_9FIRM